MKIVWALVFFMLFSPSVYAAEALLFDNVPAAYIGTFKWDNTNEIHQVVFVWEGQSGSKKGEITLQGKGIYGAIKKEHVNLKAIIDPSTYKIEIWESVDAEGEFLESGSHVGNISPDLKVIETIWTTSGTLGYLQLIRKESHSY